MCGWANSELYELIKKTYFKIKNNVNIDELQNKFHQEFFDIVNNKDSKFYNQNYFGWFFDKGHNSQSRIAKARSSIFRFLLINPNDLIYIKTQDENIIYLAYLKGDAELSFDKTRYDYKAFFMNNVEFSEPIQKDVLFKKCYNLIDQKYPTEKNTLLDKIAYLNGTCLYMLEKDDDFKLKEIFYEILNSLANKKGNDELDNINDMLLIINKVEKNPEKREYLTEQWVRDSKVKKSVINNAKGICQACGKKSFAKENGEIYLEVHHKVYLSQNGLDTVENCVALCPNCHKNEHFGKINNRKFSINNQFQDKNRLKNL